MPRNNSLGCFSTDARFCIGFYLVFLFSAFNAFGALSPNSETFWNATQLKVWVRGFNSTFLIFLTNKIKIYRHFVQFSTLIKCTQSNNFEMFFEEYINLKIVLYLRPLWSYTCSKFRKSYTPPAAWIRVKVSVQRKLRWVGNSANCWVLA
jgi:hypothetical protein